jgi:hypothetical protein
MGRILTVLPLFELLRPGTGRGPAKPRFRDSKREIFLGGILSPTLSPRLAGGEREKLSGSVKMRSFAMH